MEQGGVDGPLAPLRVQDVPFPRAPTPQARAYLLYHDSARWPSEFPLNRRCRWSERPCRSNRVVCPQEAVDVLLAGTAAADERTVLRAEMMRWHPDKFTAKLGARLKEEDKPFVLEKVNAMQQAISERYKNTKKAEK